MRRLAKVSHHSSTRTGLIVVCLLVNTSSSLVQGRVGNPGQKGSLLIYPNVEIRWDAEGNLIQDTFITLTNDSYNSVVVRLYFANGDPPLPADPPERFHPGYNWIDNGIVLTGNQPVYWKASTGSGIASQFTFLDPGTPPGRPAIDGSTDRVLRGYLLAVAAESYDGAEICWNHLFGGATIVNYQEGSAWQYKAYAFQVDSTTTPHGTVLGTPGELRLDGVEYEACPAELQFDFVASGSTAMSGDYRAAVNDTDLTLLLATVDFRTPTTGPLATKAEFDIWNMNTLSFSDAGHCVTQWDQRFLSSYDIPNYFLLPNLQTEVGTSRIDGIQSPVECGAESEDVPLLGVSMNVFDFDGLDTSFAGTTLPGAGGEQTAVIQLDVQATRINATTGRISAFHQEDIDSEPPPDRRFRDKGTSFFAVGKPGSLLVFPNIELRWDAGGNLLQDTVIELTNMADEPVIVHVCLVHGDQPLPADPPEAAHLGWNHSTDFAVLTSRQPTFWSASTGMPLGISSFLSLDPGYYPGRPALDGTYDRILRGFAYIWAVDGQGHEIRWNDLSGKSTIINYTESSSWAYLPVSFSIDSESIADGYRSGTPGILNFDGEEYGSCPSHLAMDFYATGAYPMSGGGRSATGDTDLTLLPVSADLKKTSVNPTSTKAKFDIWNGNEYRFSNTDICISHWSQYLLGSYNYPNYFLAFNLQTDQGKARIDGIRSPVECGEETEDVPLLGVSMLLLDFDAGAEVARAGATLVGMGVENAQILVDEDSNGNGILDDLEDGNDCNSNGIIDKFEIAMGSSADCDTNSIPDECEKLPGDFDGNSLIDSTDYAYFALCMLGPGGKYIDCHTCLTGDIDEDQDVDLADFSALQCTFSGQ